MIRCLECDANSRTDIMGGTCEWCTRRMWDVVLARYSRDYHSQLLQKINYLAMYWHVYSGYFYKEHADSTFTSFQKGDLK